MTEKMALAILSVGLCFYNGYREKWGIGSDSLASLVSFIAAIRVLI
jgi:hypothetical protein